MGPLGELRLPQDTGENYMETGCSSLEFMITEEETRPYKELDKAG